MLPRIDKSLASRVEQAILDVLWVQWSGLGASVTAPWTARSVIDPEALLMLSLILRQHERRLWDVVVSFARSGSKLLSVQRMKNLLGRFPEPARGLVSEFAQLARSEGNDFRWKTLEDEQEPLPARKRDLWQAYPAHWNPAALMPRLRLAFGVGITADLLVYLASSNDNPVQAKQIARAIDYSVRPVRRSAENLVAAGVITSSGGKPVEYRLETRKWAPLLGFDENAPRWRYWSYLFPLIAHLLASEEDKRWKDLSTYMFTSKIRDLLQDHEQAFRLNDLHPPELRGVGEENTLKLFAEFIVSMAEWLEDAA